MSTSVAPKAKPAARVRKAHAKRTYSSLDIEQDELEPAIAELRTAIENDRRGALERCYEIGRVIDKHYRRLVAESANWEDRGERYFDQLAAALDAPVWWLRNHFRLVECYDEAEFEELCQTPNMSATKALQLASLDDEPRAALVQRVADEGLTVRELDTAIKQEVGPRRRSGSGPAPKIPRRVTDGLTHLAAQSSQYVKISDTAWFSDQYNFVNVIKELPMDQVTDKLVAQVMDTAAKCEELAATAAKNAQALRGTLPEIERRMAVQAALEARQQAELEAEERQVGAAA